MRYEPLYNYPIVLAIKDRDENTSTNFASYIVYPTPRAAALIDSQVLATPHACNLSKEDIERIMKSAERDNLRSPLHELFDKLGSGAGLRVVVTSIARGNRHGAYKRG